MIKKHNNKGELILYECEAFVESSDRPNFLILWFNREDVGKLFKSQDILLQINGLGDPKNENIVNIQDKKRYRITLEAIEENE